MEDKNGDLVPMEKFARYVEPKDYIDVFHNRFIERLGGDVEELKIALSQDTSPRVLAFLNDLCDPRYARKGWTISAIARKNCVTPQMLMEIWRKHQISRFVVTALNGLPKLAEDTVKDGESTERPCPLCSGTGKSGKKQCPLCKGKMLVRQPGDIESRKLVLEATGILQKSKGVQVNVNMGGASIESVLDEIEGLEKPPDAENIVEADFETVE